MTDSLLESAKEVAQVFSISFNPERDCSYHKKYIQFLFDKEEEKKRAEEQNKLEIKRRQEDYMLQMKLQRERERLIAMAIKKQQQIQSQIK
jgi:hypothetical protein